MTETHWIKPALYLTLALLGARLEHALASARCPKNSYQLGLGALWRLYILAAVSCTFQGDIAFVNWARDLAHRLHMYDLRRWFQAATLLIIFLATVGLVNRQRSSLGAKILAKRSLSGIFVWTGFGVTAMLHITQFVSYHYTDLVLNYQWLNLRAASWIEGSAMALPVLGTFMEYTKRNDPV
jgi:hypothetical protein